MSSFGATENLRARLMAISKGDNECKETTTESGFELIGAGDQREARRAELVRDLEPVYA